MRLKENGHVLLSLSIASVLYKTENKIRANGSFPLAWKLITRLQSLLKSGEETAAGGPRRFAISYRCYRASARPADKREVVDPGGPAFLGPTGQNTPPPGPPRRRRVCFGSVSTPGTTLTVE